MASLLPSECLERIFLNLDDNISNETIAYAFNKALYSCTLVSRHWCRISTPILYSYPFHQIRHLSYPDDSYFKLIRTLLSCVPKNEIERIISTNSSIIQKLLYYLFYYRQYSDVLTTFNYISFIRGLIFDEKLFDPSELILYQKIWLPPYLSNHTWNFFFSNISISIINHLLKFLCKHCKNLTTLEFPFTVQNEEIFNNIFEVLTLSDCNGRNKLSGLKELYYFNTKRESTKDLYLSLSNSIYNLNLLHSDQSSLIKKADSLSHFISSQKRLQHIILSRNGVMFDNYVQNEKHYYDVVFNSLSTQSEFLQKLNFVKLNFNEFTLSEVAIDSLCLLKNIRELKLDRCGCTCPRLNVWAKSLAKLEELEFTYCYTTSDDFLIQIIQSSSHNLTKLVLGYKRDHVRSSRLLKEIPLHLYSLIHLELTKIYPEELISILKSCTQLVYLSIILLLNEINFKKFQNLGKFVPNNLKRIQFREAKYLRLNSETLKSFLKECNNCGGTLKYLEINGDDSFGKEYIDVAEQFGVQLSIL